MEQVKILLMTAIGVFTMLGVGSIAVVHASIIGDCGVGYQAGKTQAYNDYHSGNAFSDGGPHYGEDGYFWWSACYQAGYDWEWGTLKQSQP
jgi:hypothetical protein